MDELILKLKKKLQDLGGGLSDNKGFVQRGRPTLEPIKNAITPKNIATAITTGLSALPGANLALSNPQIKNTVSTAIENRYVRPVMDIPANFAKLTSPGRPLKDRVSGAIGVLGGVATFVPDPIQDAAIPAYDFLKGYTSAAVRGQGLPQRFQAGIKSLTLEKPVGLGDAVSKQPNLQLALNVAELPFLAIAGAKLTSKNYRNATPLTRPPIKNNPLTSATQQLKSSEYLNNILKNLGLVLEDSSSNYLRGSHGRFDAKKNKILIAKRIPQDVSKEEIIAHEIGHFIHNKLSQDELDEFNFLVKSFRRDIEESPGRKNFSFQEKGGKQGYFEMFADLFAKYLLGEKLPAGRQFEMFFDTVTPKQVREIMKQKIIPANMVSPVKKPPSIEIPTDQLTNQPPPKTKAPQSSLLPPKAASLKDDFLSTIPIKNEIDVKEKVGILDYFRTPDRVLKKIGLGEEGALLRQQYEKYLTDLKSNIEKISNWAKSLPKESSQKIFKFLDGQKIDLTPQEAKVANEIKDYLSDWADRLGLPKDKRISHYITHIFERDFVQKEFDPELAKIIRDRVPGSVYDPFLEKRLGKMGYVEDVWRALDAYVKRATRKVNIDVALEKIRQKADSLEQSQYDYVKKYIDNVNLRPSEIDNLIDNTIKQIAGYRFGQRPVAYLSKIARQAVYRGLLGLNVGTAVRNLTQGVNTYARLGERYTLQGYFDLLRKGTKELEENNILGQGIVQDRSLSAARKLWENLDKGLFFFFELAEKINRGAAYYGAKAKALAQGMDEKNAIEYAKKMVRDTQFQFGSIDTPVALQSDLAKTLAQLQSFSLKQGEFLLEMTKNKEYAGLLRYVLGSILLANVIGGLIGTEFKDFIPSLRVGLPPTIQAPIEAGKALLGAPNRYGQVPPIEERTRNVIRSLIPYIPAGVQLKKTIEGLSSVKKGYSETPKGRIKFTIEQSPKNYARAALFGVNNLDEARQYRLNKTLPLGIKQSEKVKNSSDMGQTYQNIIASRTNEKIKRGGNADVSSLSFPKLTGREELDKRAISLYKKEIASRANDIYMRYRSGKLTEEEAEKQLVELAKLRSLFDLKKGKKIQISPARKRRARLQLKPPRQAKLIIKTKRTKVPRIRLKATRIKFN